MCLGGTRRKEHLLNRGFTKEASSLWATAAARSPQFLGAALYPTSASASCMPRALIDMHSCGE
jgi:hypothetical protein